MFHCRGSVRESLHLESTLTRQHLIRSSGHPSDPLYPQNWGWSHSVLLLPRYEQMKTSTVTFNFSIIPPLNFGLQKWVMPPSIPPPPVINYEHSPRVKKFRNVVSFQLLDWYPMTWPDIDMQLRSSFSASTFSIDTPGVIWKWRLKYACLWGRGKIFWGGLRGDQHWQTIIFSGPQGGHRQ